MTPILAKPPRRKSRRRSGQALLIALGVTLILVSILTVTASSQRTAMQAQSARMSQRRTSLIARSAAELAIQYLMEGKSGISGTTSAASTSTSTSTVTTTVTTLTDDWATLGDTGAVKFVVGSDSFRMQVVDTCSLMDINQTTPAQLVTMGLTQEQADCINDYRTAGETPAADGAKDSYYNGLANPYNAKLANFDTLDELLLVKGITPDVLYDPQTSTGTVTLQTLTNGATPALYDLCTAYAYAPNTTATGGTRVNVNTSTAAQLVQRGISPTLAALLRPAGGRPTTWTSLGQIFTTLGGNLSQADQRAILNNLTVTAATQQEGALNINTASQNVLMTVPGITSDIATAIVAQQQSGFSTLGAIVSVPGISTRVLGTLANRISIASTSFEARIVATAGSTQTAYIAIVQVTAGVPKIVSISPAPFSAAQMISRWGWESDTTSETDLVQSS